VEAGVTVGLGSDGYVNDFYEVVRAAFLIHKAHKQDPRVMPASLVWYLATEGGARALGLEKVGRIAAGWQADLQLVDTRMPTPTEEHNLYDQLVLWRSHAHVRLVMVAGQVRVRHHRPRPRGGAQIVGYGRVVGWVDLNRTRMTRIRRIFADQISANLPNQRHPRSIETSTTT
jgi:cytosine/adenosine deaminase-related metal-dependent hydrolase